MRLLMLQHDNETCLVTYSLGACGTGDKPSGTMWTTNCTNVLFDFDGSDLEVSSLQG